MSTGRFVGAEEARADKVMPYRGTETHGVTVTDEWSDVPQMGANEPVVEFQDPPPDTDPVPVRIVSSDSGRERKDFRVHHEYATIEAPARVAGQNDRRTALRVLVNEGEGVRVWFGNSEQVTAWTGYPVDGGSEFTTTSQSDVWVIADTGPDPRKLIVLEEVTYEL